MMKCNKTKYHKNKQISIITQSFSQKKHNYELEA